MFRKEITTEIEINASAEKVWSLITDFESFPKWNPLMLRVRGRAVEGAHLEILIHLFLSADTVAKPVVLKVDPHKELRWAGRFPIPGLLAGEHILVIEPLETGGVRLIQREIWTGLAVPVFMVWLGWEIHRGFEKMNKEVKRLAESPQPDGAERPSVTYIPGSTE